MGTAIADSSRSVVIKNAQGVDVTGTSVVIGSSASFSAHLSSTSGIQYVFQISGASFSGGSCSGARSTVNGKSFTPMGAGVVSVHVGFATGYRGISISPVATITFTAATTTSPTAMPTKLPSARPTTSPSALPTTLSPAFPTALPTTLPTFAPSAFPSALPTTTALPTALSTVLPSAQPTVRPTAVPSTTLPSPLPTVSPTARPTSVPSSAAPSAAPSPAPTSSPSTRPSPAPTPSPSPAPSIAAIVLQVGFSVSGFASLAEAQASKGAIKSSLAVSLQLNETNIVSLTLSVAARRLQLRDGRALADGVDVAALVNVPTAAAATSVDSSLTSLASSFAANMAATGVTVGVTNLVTVNISPTLTPTVQPTQLLVSAPAASVGGINLVVILAGAGGGLALIFGIVGYVQYSRARQAKVDSTAAEGGGPGGGEAEGQVPVPDRPAKMELGSKKKGPKSLHDVRRGVVPTTLHP